MGVLFAAGLVWFNCGWSALVSLLEHILWLFSSESKPVYVLWDYSDVNQDMVSRDDWEVTTNVCAKVHACYMSILSILFQFLEVESQNTYKKTQTVNNLTDRNSNFPNP